MFKSKKQWISIFLTFLMIFSQISIISVFADETEEESIEFIYDTNIPMKINMNENIVQVEANRNSVVALDEDGNVFTWGDGSYYDLGHGTDNANVYSPKKVEGLPIIKQVAKGKNHTLAIAENGDIWGWGNNSSGELGSDLKGKVYVPTKISGISNATEISAGEGFSVAVAGGDLWTWGKNNYGQLGIRDVPNGVPGRVFTDREGYRGIDCGDSYFMTLFNWPEPNFDYSLGSCGRNNSGQLGNSNNIDSPDLGNIADIEGSAVKQLSAGREHSLAIAYGDYVYSWGRNSVGQLGLDDKVDRNSPERIESLDNICFVDAAYGHSIAISYDGSVYTWGEGRDGQMGNGEYATSRVPVKIDGITNAKSATGGSNFTIVLDENGDMWSFGNNEFGQLGLMDYTPDKVIPPNPESLRWWTSTIRWEQYMEGVDPYFEICNFNISEAIAICRGKSYTIPRQNFTYNVIYADYDYEDKSDYELCAKVYYDDRAEYYLNPGHLLTDEVLYFDDYALIPIRKLYSDKYGQLHES